MKTPERIWLREDREDPEHIIWGSDQPAEGGIEYIIFRPKENDSRIGREMPEGKTDNENS